MKWTKVHGTVEEYRMNKETWNECRDMELTKGHEWENSGTMYKKYGKKRRKSIITWIINDDMKYVWKVEWMIHLRKWEWTSGKVVWEGIKESIYEERVMQNKSLK